MQDAAVILTEKITIKTMICVANGRVINDDNCMGKES